MHASHPLAIGWLVIAQKRLETAIYPSVCVSIICPPSRSSGRATMIFAASFLLLSLCKAQREIAFMPQPRRVLSLGPKFITSPPPLSLCPNCRFLSSAPSFFSIFYLGNGRLAEDDETVDVPIVISFDAFLRFVESLGKFGAIGIMPARLVYLKVSVPLGSGRSIDSFPQSQ